MKLYPISVTGSSEDVWGWAPDLETLEERGRTPVLEPERRWSCLKTALRVILAWSWRENYESQDVLSC